MALAEKTGKFSRHKGRRVEKIMERADSKKERMGLTTWKNSPHGKIIKTDVSIVQDRLFESDFD